MSDTNDKKMKILIVDDEDAILDVLCESATDLGFEVISARNGLEALEKLKVHRVSLILSDIKMPVCSGLQLLAKCRKQNMLTPFIFITGNNTIESVIEAVRLGALDFLLKPFEYETLSKVLKRASAIAERQEYIDELLLSIGHDVAPQTHIEINNLKRQINLLRAMGD